MLVRDNKTFIISIKKESVLQFLYIEGYLKVNREIKVSFLKYINDFEEIKVSRQKLVVEEDSLLIELEDDSNVEFAIKKIESFFNNNHQVSVRYITRILNGGDSLILVYGNDVFKRINK